MLKTFCKKIYRKIFPTWISLLKRETEGMESVLDIGCGHDSPIQHVSIKKTTGVDFFDDYIKSSEEKKIHSEYIKADITAVDFEPKSYEVVLCSEVIEHLKKDVGLKLLEKMEKWAAKKVIITTPNGFLPQPQYDENKFQEHQSGWSVEDFRKRGYRVYGINGLKWLKGQQGVIKFWPKRFWQMMSDLTQKIVYWFPSLAFQLLAVKDIK